MLQSNERRGLFLQDFFIKHILVQSSILLLQNTFPLLDHVYSFRQLQVNKLMSLINVVFALQHLFFNAYFCNSNAEKLCRNNFDGIDFFYVGSEERGNQESSENRD